EELAFPLGHARATRLLSCLVPLRTSRALLHLLIDAGVQQHWIDLHHHVPYSAANSETSQRRAAARGLPADEVVADDSPSLHHELHLLEDADIRERIAFDRDQVRVVAGFERANLVRPA